MITNVTDMLPDMITLKGKKGMLRQTLQGDMKGELKEFQ